MSSTNPDSKPANLITAWTQRDWCWNVVFMVFMQRILEPVFPNWVAFIGLCLKTIPSVRERAVLALARTSKQAYLNNTSMQTDAARDKTSHSKPGTSFQSQPKGNILSGQFDSLGSAPSSIPSPYCVRHIRQNLRAYPNNRVVMRPSEKFEAKAAGQKCSEAWFSPR
jgi:hypothetical protein